MSVPIVGVGASAGGLESLQGFFEAVPQEPQMSFVVIQHLSPHFKSMMGQLLARSTTLPIELATSGTVVEPNRIYLLPPGKLMVIVDSCLVLSDKSDEGLDFPIDCFLESLARAQGVNGGAVILSGTGSDGARGVDTIKEHGGVAFAETEATAKFFGMPKSAIATGKLDGVLRPNEIPAALAQAFARERVPEPQAHEPTVAPEQLTPIFKRIQERHGVDYSLYKSATITRRLVRRAELEGLPVDSLLERAKTEERLQDLLYQDFLITVTKFFRDPWSFDELQNQLRQLLLTLEPSDELRLWSAGCATGEEAYSLAIVAHEVVESLGLQRVVRVFATDINPDSLRTGEEAVYQQDQLAHVSAARLDKFFERVSNGYRVSSQIRASVLFQHHDLLHDVPFTQLHVVSCRNLLIYLDKQAQKKALSFFHFALTRGGLLLLGPSESTDPLHNAFALKNDAARIFQKTQRLGIAPDLAERIRMRVTESHRVRDRAVDEQRIAVYDALCNRFMPPAILLDHDQQVLETFGGAEKYLRIRGRRFSTNFLDLLDARLKGSIAGALRMLSRSDEPVIVRAIELEQEEQPVEVDLQIEKLGQPSPNDDLILVSILAPNTREERRSATEFSVDRQHDDQIMQLEHELGETRAFLQESIERAEASNQELHATNEELIASNEELQSTNEELSSVNEELYTINSEYQNSISELREANADISHLLSNTDIATLFLDKDLRIRRFTPHLAAIMDVLENDIGRKITAFQHNLEWPDFYESLNHVLSTGESLIHETRTSDGTRYIARIHGYNANAQTSGVVVTLTDVTRLALTEAALAEREDRLEQLADALPMLVSYVDSNERYQFVNRAYERTWQVERHTLLGKTVREVLGGKNYRTTKPWIDRARTGKSSQFEMMADFPGGERWIRVHYIPRSEGEDKPHGFYVTATDLSDEHANAEALRKARDAADNASKAKTEFLANMSHEIRTPLTAILGYAELLANETNSDEGKEYVRTIRRNGQHLLAIINDVLDLSRIEEGHVRIERENFSVLDLIAEVHELFRLHAQDKGIVLKVELPETVPAKIESDPRRIRQVLFNLVSNAIKFTEEGSVTVKLFAFDRDENMLRVEVRDTGIGFPQEKAKVLFEPFRQLDGSGARQHEGSGLGLAICNRLVRTLGGHIVAQSVAGAGSSFLMELPVRVSADTGEVDASQLGSQPPPEMPKLSHNILVVDDKLDVRELLREGLTLAGATVTTLSSGEKALEFHDAGKLEGFDAVIMDVQMPKLDGLQTTRQLRERGVKTPIIALTARALEQDRDECLEAGCSDYMTKPIDLPRVAQVILALVQQSSSQLVSAVDESNAEGSRTDDTPTEQAKAASPSVLVVDDHEDSAVLMVTVLRAKGMNASYALDLDSALARLQRDIPDVLISDINFAGKPLGFELAKEARKASSQIRIVGLSGADVAAEALRAGFDKFFTKPCSPEDIATWIRS